MTKEHILEKYGDVELKFSEYFKYNFLFKGTTSYGEIIIAEVGGSADDAYSLVLGSTSTINGLDPHSITVMKENSKIAKWSNL